MKNPVGAKKRPSCTRLRLQRPPFSFRQFPTQIKRFRVSNRVVFQCAELFANAADSAADAGHHHLFRFGTWLDGSPAWSAPERLIQAMPHKASQRNGIRGTAVFGTRTTQTRNASQGAAVLLLRRLDERERDCSLDTTIHALRPS